ncbi:MAG: hypothetical protein JSV04_05070, partial [Candidatus Heimdallarchaeota archaeon]
VTIFDFINAIILSTERGVINPISVQIGFFISIIGPIVTFLGLIAEVKVVREVEGDKNLNSLNGRTENEAY